MNCYFEAAKIEARQRRLADLCAWKRLEGVSVRGLIL